MFALSQKHTLRRKLIKLRGVSGVYHTIHHSNKARGGPTVTVKNELKHYEETKYQTGAIQTTSVKVQTKYKQYMISAVYYPSRYTLKKEDFANVFQTLGKYCIIGGDFNVKHTHWGSRTITSKGKELCKAGAVWISLNKKTHLLAYWSN